VATAWNAIEVEAKARVGDPARLQNVTILEVNEHIWPPSRIRVDRAVTIMVDLSRDQTGCLHAPHPGAVVGRYGIAPKAWLQAQGDRCIRRLAFCSYCVSTHCECLVSGAAHGRGLRSLFDIGDTVASLCITGGHLAGMVDPYSPEVLARMQMGDEFAMMLGLIYDTGNETAVSLNQDSVMPIEQGARNGLTTYSCTLTKALRPRRSRVRARNVLSNANGERGKMDAALLLDEFTRAIRDGVAEFMRAQRKLVSLLGSDPPPPCAEINRQLGLPIGGIGRPGMLPEEAKPDLQGSSPALLRSLR
jgi:hypothetical protein